MSNKVRSLFLLLFLTCPALFATEDSNNNNNNTWTNTDTIIEVASETGLACEWAEMCSSTSIHGIDSRIMSSHPKREAINLYFLSWLVIHPIISYNLNKPYRTIWQGATISFELVVSEKNYGAGCHIHF